jgi:hypothetical protein
MKEDYIESQFVTYEIAIQLKSLDFDEECFGCFINDIAEPMDRYQFILGSTYSYNITNHDTELDYVMAPLWQQVIDWLDSEFGLMIVVVHDKKFGYQWKITTNKNKVVYDCAVTYQRLCNAREQAILKALELCKKEK